MTKLINLLNNIKMVKLIKKGATPAISWVLLMGVVVMLAGVTTLWMKSMAETSVNKVVTNTEKDIRCEEVSILAYEFPGTNGCSNITIENRGWFNIDKMRIVIGNSQSINETIIVPGSSATIDLNSLIPPTGTSEVIIIPATELEEEIIFCMNKKANVKCT